MKANMKKVLSMLLVVTLTAGIAIGGTMAYLTMDAGDEKNIFSIGNINVSLDEEVGILGEGGEIKETEDGAEYIGVMPGDYLKKKVTVTNNGKTDAYVAVTVTLNNANKINAAIDDVYEKDPYNYTSGEIQAVYTEVFDGWGINYNPRPGAHGVNDARGVIDGTYGLPEHVLNVDFTKTIPDDYWLYSAGNWFYGSAEKAGTYDAGYYTNGEGYYAKNMDPNEICYTYYLYLPAGESSTLFKGLNVPAEFNANQLAMFDGLVIDIEAKAIQADNMAVASQYKNDVNGKAKTAFAILAGDMEVPEDYTNKPTGELTPAYASMVGQTSWNSIWGEAYTNAKESLVIKVYSGDTYLGSNTLNDLSKSAAVTWHCYLNDEDFEAWSMTWTQKPTIDLLPTTVELWVDGEKVDETNVKMNCPDNLAPITGAVINAKGEIVKFTTENWTGELGEGESYGAFISDNQALANAIENGATTVILADGEYTIPASAKGKTLTISGGKGAIIKMNTDSDNYDASDYNLDGSTVTFNGITHQAATSGSAQGYARATLTFNNCDLKGYMDLPEVEVSTFNNCTFDVSGDLYCIWTWGSDEVYFNNCTFNTDGKAILVYNAACDVYVKDCTFNDRSNGTNFTKSAIETGYDYSLKSYNIHITNTTVNGFAENDKCVGFKNIVGNKNSMTQEYLNIVVDGVDVY